MARERIVTTDNSTPEEGEFNWALRPTTLDEYIGQPTLIERLQIAIQAAKMREEPIEHVLLHGPPGLGKTTLAHVISKEMGTQLHATSGPALTRAGDLVGTLTRLTKGDVLFIDEIHRLPKIVEEYIYSAMEDFRIDVPIDSGMHSRIITLHLKPFTLIGATTRTGMVSGPMRSRFGIPHHLDFYSPDDLHTIADRSAHLLKMNVENPNVLESLARRSRGTPRIINRLLRRTRDYALVHNNGKVTTDLVDATLKLEGIDALGLDELDRQYMLTIATTYEGGPVGLEAVAATLNEDAGTLEDTVEPYLLQIGLIARTRRGRQLTAAGMTHIGNSKSRPNTGAGSHATDVDNVDALFQ